MVSPLSHEAVTSPPSVRPPSLPPPRASLQLWFSEHSTSGWPPSELHECWAERLGRDSLQEGRGDLYGETVGVVSPPLVSRVELVEGGPWQQVLVGSPVVAVVCRLVHLGLLLNGGVLAALPSGTLQRQDTGPLTSWTPPRLWSESTSSHEHTDPALP